MGLIQIYQCLCDPTRLRILNLLTEGELCVCHFQEILGESQVKVSKHLAYLKARGLVEARKEANWMIYSLPAKRSKELAANLACLQDCVQEDDAFRRDRERRRKFVRSIAGGPACCGPSPTPRLQHEPSALPSHHPVHRQLRPQRHRRVSAARQRPGPL
ncbi:MAG TPA: metalloregulator ArsR/SmtB family transcription factor [Opitutaceae bacterium]|jgi:ArsR family transcriptional regulator|nr:metalloregulator ArsR/SmtB family transcription factor [Opitutaceae bacterium]